MCVNAYGVPALLSLVPCRRPASAFLLVATCTCPAASKAGNEQPELVKHSLCSECAHVSCAPAEPLPGCVDLPELTLHSPLLLSPLEMHLLAKMPLIIAMVSVWQATRQLCVTLVIVMWFGAPDLAWYNTR